MAPLSPLDDDDEEEDEDDDELEDDEPPPPSAVLPLDDPGSSDPQAMRARASREAETQIDERKGDMTGSYEGGIEREKPTGCRSSPL